MSVFVKNHVSLRRVPVDLPTHKVHLRELPTVGEQLCDCMDCFGWCRWRNRSCCSVLKLLYLQGLQFGIMGCWLVGFPNTMISMILVASGSYVTEVEYTWRQTCQMGLYYTSPVFFNIHHEWQWFVIQTCCFPNWMYRSGFTVSGWPPNLTLIIDAYIWSSIA